MTFPAPAAQRPRPRTDQRCHPAARLLHDDRLDLTDRVAGGLLLLYGQQLSRIAAMTTDQVTICDDEVLLRLGPHAIPSPDHSPP